MYGMPLVRALFWEFPDEPELFGVDRQFMVGRDILVTPVLEPGLATVPGECTRYLRLLSEFSELIGAAGNYRHVSWWEERGLAGLVHA